MRIGIIHWGFPPRAGGVEAHLATLCPELMRLGHQVFVLTETMAGLSDEQCACGVKVIRRNELSPANLDKCIEEGKNIYAKVRPLLENFIRTNAIDVIHAHNAHMDFFDFARALTDTCSQNQIPCIIILHNHIFIDRNPLTTRRIITECPWTKIVSVSKFIEEEIIKSVPRIDKNRLQIIMHGIDLEKFSPLTCEEKEKIKQKYNFTGRNIILHPARIIPWKGIVEAIRAMPKIAERFPESLMVLTGRIKPIHKDQDEISHYNNLVDRTIEELNLKDYVYMGKYTYKDIPSLTKIADVVIYTTIKDEPFGLCPVEAMACGVPAIVTASGGLRESVVNGQTGYIIEKDEKELPAQLAQRAIELFSQPNLRRKMGEAGRERTKAHFALARMAEDFIKVSEEVVLPEEELAVPEEVVK